MVINPQLETNPDPAISAEEIYIEKGEIDNWTPVLPKDFEMSEENRQNIMEEIYDIENKRRWEKVDEVMEKNKEITLSNLIRQQEITKKATEEMEDRMKKTMDQVQSNIVRIQEKETETKTLEEKKYIKEKIKEKFELVRV